MESASGKFSCAACGRSYGWKPELANRKVKCKCGQIMTAPPAPPADAPEEEEDLYALKDDPAPRAAAAVAPQPPLAATVTDNAPRCPACSHSMAPGAILCTACGYNLRTRSHSPPASTTPGLTGTAAAGVLAYQHGALGAPRRREEFENALGGDAWHELYLPGALVIAGLFLHLAFVAWTEGSWSLGMRLLPQIGVSLLVNLVLSFGGIFLLARLLELSFGAPLPAVLKLVAICLVPPVLAAFVGNLVGPDSFFVRVMVSSIVMIPLMYIAFWWLFDMDFADAIYCVTLLWIVNQWLVLLIVSALFSSASNGALSQAAVNEQQQARQIVSSEFNPDAKSWIDDSANHILGSMGHQASADAIQALYDLGATAHVVRDGGIATDLVVILPRDRDQRAQIFAWRQTLVPHTVNNDPDHLTDNGQKYLVIEFSTRYYK